MFHSLKKITVCLEMVKTCGYQIQIFTWHWYTSSTYLTFHCNDYTGFQVLLSSGSSNKVPNPAKKKLKMCVVLLS